MTPTTSRTWIAKGGLMVRRGQQSRPVDATFTLGTTEPTIYNAGVTGTPRSNYNGTLTGGTQASPTKISNVNLNRLVTLNGGYFEFFNVLFAGGPGTFNTGQVDCRPSAHQGALFNRCTFEPATRSYYLNNLIGHHMDAYRCVFKRGVDTIGSYNEYASRTDNKIRGCLGLSQTRYDVDADHSDGTHNDFVQHQSGLGLDVIGNSVQGYTIYDDGSTPPDPYNRTAQFVLTQQNVAVGGTYYLGEVTVSSNWIRGFQQGIVIKTRTSGGQAYDVTAVNNRWANADQRDFGGTYHFYNMRADGATTFNGISYPTTGATADTNGNAYADTAEVGATYRGQAVLVRRDAGLGV